jgi:hypothetical protein
MLPPDLAEVDDRDWAEARRRLDLIEPVLEKARLPRTVMAARARAFRTTGLLSSLLPYKPAGGRRKSLKLKTELLHKRRRHMSGFKRNFKAVRKMWQRSFVGESKSERTRPAHGSRRSPSCSDRRYAMRSRAIRLCR